MEEAMIEIIGVKEGSEELSRGKERGSRGTGDERRKRSRRGGTLPGVVAHIGSPGTPKAKAGRPKVQGKPKRHCESLP